MNHYEKKIESFDCHFFGHRWTLVPADECNMARWGCERCHWYAGLPSQHRATPSRWLWTFWCDNTTSIYKIYTGRG